MEGKYQKGKATCKILRQIRQQIADENDIPLVTKDCTYQGDCKGTCPKCEAELRYLEEQLARRQKLGKRIAVAAIATTLLAGAGTAAVNALVPVVLDPVLEAQPMGYLVYEDPEGDIAVDTSACETTEPETTPPETTRPDTRTEKEKEWDERITGMLYVPSERQEF